MSRLKKAVTTLKARIETAKDIVDDSQPWLKQVAMLTGILAAVSGFLAVRSTTLTNDAIYESNQAILAQAESSDAWSEYQSNSIKAHIIETALATSASMTPDKRAGLEKDVENFRDRQTGIKQTALMKANERDLHLKNGLRQLAEKDLLGYAGLAAQLGIALASVAALVRLRIAFYAGILTGGIGVIITLYAFAMHYELVLL